MFLVGPVGGRGRCPTSSFKEWYYCKALIFVVVNTTAETTAETTATATNRERTIQRGLQGHRGIVRTGTITP